MIHCHKKLLKLQVKLTAFIVIIKNFTKYFHYLTITELMQKQLVAPWPIQLFNFSKL